MPDIVITPNRGTSSNPKIDFTGTSAGTIKLEVLGDGTIAWNGANGSLFSIADSLSGSLMSVNDISGLPAFEVFSDNRVVVGQFGANLLLGKTTSSSNGRLQLTSHTTNTGGIGFGSDVTLFRSAADILKTEDSFHANGEIYALASGGGLKFSASGTTGIIVALQAGGIQFRNSSNANLLVLANNGDATITGSVLGLSFLGSGSTDAGLISTFRNTNAGTNAYSSIYLGNDTASNKLVMFVNSSTRTADGGAGNTTIRTDSGSLILGAAGTTRMTMDGTATYMSGLTQFPFDNTDTDQWPLIRFGLSYTTAPKWDEGIIKGSSSRGVFGKQHMGIHFHEDRSFAFHTSGWDTEMEINGDGKIYMKGPVGIGTNAPGYKLDVNGDIAYRGVKQSNTTDIENIKYFSIQKHLENDNFNCFPAYSGTLPTIVTENNTTSPYSKLALFSASFEAEGSDFIPVQPGERLYGEVWAKRLSGATGNAGAFYAGITRYDKDKRVIDANLALVYFIAGGVTIPTNGNWQKYSATVVLPTTHTPYTSGGLTSDGGPVRYVKAYLIVNYGGGTIPTYVTGLTIRKVDVIKDSGIVNFNGNLGLSNLNTIPLDKLDISGTTAAYPGRIMFGDGGNYTPYMKFHKWTGVSTDYYQTTIANSITVGGALEFYTGGSGGAAIGSDTQTLRMLITSGGNVAIGATSPSSNTKLDVIQSGSTAVSALRLRAGNNSTSFNSNQLVLSYDATADYSHAIKTRHHASDYINAIDFYVWRRGVDAASTIGTQHVMTLIQGAAGVDDTGRVGIGLTDPTAKLDIKGTVTGTYASSTQQVVARFLNNPASLGSGNNSSFISLQTTADGGSSNPIARLGVVGETYGSNAGAFVVATRSGSDNLIYERFRVDSNGYLSTPTGSQLSYQDATTFTIWSSEAEYSVVDDNGDSSYKVMKSFIAEKSGSLRVKFSAYIQSGTYYWAWRIRKANSTVLASGNYANGLDTGEITSVHAYRRFSALISVNPGDVITVEMVSSDGSGNPVAGNSQTLYLKELRIYSSVTSSTHGSLNVFGDYVGIGTWTPKARLEVRPPTSVLYSSTIPYQPTTAAILSPVMPAASTDTYTSILQLVSIRQALVAGRYAHGYLGFSTVDNSNLDGVLDAGRISIKNDDGVGLYSATSMGFWTNPGGGASTAAIERVRISSSGNVGIATTDPAYRLQLGTHFSGTQTQTSMFINAGGATTAGAIFISPDGNSSVGAKIGQYFESPANIQRLDLGTVGYSGVYPTVSIKEGKMGIGTTSPGYKLEVTGDAYITEALKQGNVETRSFAVTFSDGVANRATDIRFPNTYINGLIEVEVTSSYSNQNSVGVVKKIFSVGANPTNSIWNTTVARVVEAHGVAADNWTIGDFAWDATNSKYIIPVYHIVSSGNVLNINIRYFSQAAVSSPVLPTTTVSAQYTATIPAAYQTRHYVYYNDRLGIGTSAPSTLFQVAGLGTGNFRLDTNGSGGHYYQAESNARLGLGRDLITSAGHISFTMAGASVNTVGAAITMPANSQLGFYTSNGSNLTQRVVIDGNGNVGIGAPSPDHKLHVIGAIRYNSNSNPITEYAGAVDGPDGYPTCTDNARIYTIGTINANASYNGYIEIEVIGSHRGFTVDSYYEYGKWILTVGDKVSSRLVFSSGSLRVGLWNGTDASGYLGNTGGINAINLALRLIINPSCGAGRRYTIKVKYADINLTHGPFTYTTHTSNSVTVPYSQYHLYGDNAIIGNETGNVYIRPNGNASVGIGTGSVSYNLEVAKASAGATFAVNADTAAAGEASIIAFTSRQYNTYYKAAIIAYDPYNSSYNRRGLALCVNNAADGSSATYASHKALYIAPDKNSTFYGDVTVAGALTVQDSTESTNTFGLKTFTKSLTVTTSWSDVGISGADLATGSYLVQVYVHNYTVSGGQYDEYYTGSMSWFSSTTNSTDVDEIVLHKAGHAPNGNWINLRTVRQAPNLTLKLQIIASGNTSGAVNYVFKFRRMI